MLISHYAPALPLRMGAVSVAANEGLLAFGPPLAGAGAVFQLSVAGNLNEAGARLFEGLHWLDGEGARLGLRAIAAMAVPEAGLGLAINDRLARAAAPRG
jgi:L-threonylcarbamoyladenylate synthase